jgi:shikimate dehydrogenase
VQAWLCATLADELVKEIYTVADLKNWKKATRDVDPPIRLGVFGDPVAHSLSPQMQNAALRHCQLDMQYARFQISPEELETALRLLPELDFIGVNLTIPHKIPALAFLDELHPHAREIGAVNTVLVQDKKLIGYNTDGPAFARAIRSEFSMDLRDLQVMLLGAGGGAGRAIARQCALENCERLILVNRTPDKAKQLVAELIGFFAGARVLGPVARLEAVRWEERAIRFQLDHTDLVVNATSLGWKRTDPPALSSSLLAPHLMVYDLIYKPERTPLLAACAESGARGANGLSMLLHQGALAFEIWLQREPPIDVMRAAL